MCSGWGWVACSLSPALLALGHRGTPAHPPRKAACVWRPSPSPVSKVGSSSSDMYSDSSNSSGRSHWARTRLSSGRNSSAPAPSPVGRKRKHQALPGPSACQTLGDEVGVTVIGRGWGEDALLSGPQFLRDGSVGPTSPLQCRPWDLCLGGGCCLWLGRGRWEKLCRPTPVGPQGRVEQLAGLQEPLHLGTG